MFFKTKKYKVKLKGRSEVVYEEEKKKLILDVELLSGKTADFGIYFGNDIRWEAPYDTEKISEEDRLRIKANITSDFEKDSVRFRWE